MTREPLLPGEKLEIVRRHLAASRISKENRARVLALLEGEINIGCPRSRLMNALFGENPSVDLQNLSGGRLRAVWDVWIESFGGSGWNPYHPNRQPDNYSSFLVYAFHKSSSGTSVPGGNGGGPPLMYDHTTDPLYAAETA